MIVSALLFLSLLSRTGYLSIAAFTAFVSPQDENVTLRAYASFFEAGVRPAFLIVETLDGDPARSLLGLQVWVGARIPAPEEARALLGEHGVVCRVGEIMPEDLMVEA